MKLFHALIAIVVLTVVSLTASLLMHCVPWVCRVANHRGGRAADLTSSPAVLASPMNILFLGTDVVYSHSGKTAVSDQSSYQGNSDSMMLVRLDPLHNKIVVLQIPRDTKVTIAGHGEQKINAANPIGGPALAEQTVGALLDTSIDHYVVMNVKGVVDIVDELGGITVQVPKRMKYADSTAKLNIDLSPGEHVLTGEQAIGFVRYRHDALGDIGRVQRQQIFMNAVVKKVLDPASWPHIPALLSIAQKNVQTDVQGTEMLTAANFVRGVPKKSIQFLMLPGRFGGKGYWLVDESEAKQLLASLDGRFPVADNNGTHAIVVCVQNISSDPQLAHKISSELRRRGYSTYVSRPLVRSSDWHETQIIPQRGNIADAEAIWKELGMTGSILNFSIGDIGSAVTVLASDDLADIF